MLTAVESTSTQALRLTLTRQLAEVLMRGVTGQVYKAPEKLTVMPQQGTLTRRREDHVSEGPWKPKKYAGINQYRQDVSLTLLEAVQELQPLSVCKKMGLRPRGTFCAGVVSGPGNPDSGDSGSALVGKNHVQIGLVSYKVSHYSLVMYTNVSYHFYWIRNNAQKLYCRHNLG
ncbi:uncharacterized protein LOC114349562 [Ostrinia furnacalis]|uniref:uncharacterized protein LOC114349562 n=1 Tax=Ostrinia furnacalis TaxID=93504 RepID=UPI00103F18A0|nr:uncharacterized protein LOC114349562 [Ostrinia furnacalis]